MATEAVATPDMSSLVRPETSRTPGSTVEPGAGAVKEICGAVWSVDSVGCSLWGNSTRALQCSVAPIGSCKAEHRDPVHCPDASTSPGTMVRVMSPSANEEITRSRPKEPTKLNSISPQVVPAANSIESIPRDLVKRSSPTTAPPTDTSTTSVPAIPRASMEKTTG